jgi:hypothetical protein
MLMTDGAAMVRRAEMRKRLVAGVAGVALAVGLVGCGRGSSGRPGAPSATTIAGSQAAPGGRVTYVAGSTQKVCQLTGETDDETGQLTSSQTASRFGYKSGDLGYSFTYNNQLWFLFGDSQPTLRFNGQPNTEGRWPYDPQARGNDAVAYATARGGDGCPILNFVPQTTGAVGAYTNPSVTLDGTAVSLRNYEVPVSGISVDGGMYVIFATDKPPCPGTCVPNTTGFATRSVMGVLADPATLQFRGLYNFSAPPTPFAEGAKFVNVAIASGNDGWVYFWGTEGGTGYRHSPAFLARVKAADIATPGGLDYLTGINSDGTPDFVAGSESAAQPLFHDEPDDCMGELGVEWDSVIGRWVMLYNCADRTAGNLSGIYMRTAPHPWGPWSPAQTIFNPVRDHGYCSFIHRGGSPLCDHLSTSSQSGGGYAPYFLAGWTTGTPATATTPATSTFYYTLSTWIPYTQVIMKTTVEEDG